VVAGAAIRRGIFHARARSDQNWVQCFGKRFFEPDSWSTWFGIGCSSKCGRATGAARVNLLALVCWRYLKVDLTAASTFASPAVQEPTYTPCHLGNTVTGCSRPCSPTLEVVFADRLHFGRRRPDAAELRADAEASGGLEEERTDRRHGEGGHLRGVCRGQIGGAETFGTNCA
jgi:hypothetical protein